jgi:membrane associated rhomboid family serine protease
MPPRTARSTVTGYLRRTGVTIGGFIALIWIVWLINATLFGGALFAFGIRPREAAGLIGIPLHPLLHGDLAHVLHNSLGLLMFGTLLYLREESDFWIVTAIGTLLGGFGVWLLGRPSIHIGASTVIFAYFGYLLSAGLFERRIGSLILSVVLFFGWGSILLGVLPLQRGISWEGHLFGFAAGVVAASLLARRRPRTPARVIRRTSPSAEPHANRHPPPRR